MSCKWVARDRPRIIVGRHEQGCSDENCRGCQPCNEPHCRVCGLTHASGTCAECLADSRANLREIGRLCGSLPEEVENRGIDGEAMFLLGPAADPEARGHLEASVAVGRVSADYLAEAVGETHPVWVLGTWQMVYVDALEHETNDDAVTIAEAVDYLDRQLTYVSGYEHVPFEDFARDLRQCVAHLESVLHDGEQRDEGVPCLTCGRRLTRVWGKDAQSDGWECKHCREQSTEAQYRFAVKADYIAKADWLTDTDMVARFVDAEMSAATVRSWASDRPGRPAVVRKRRHSERTEFSVEDVAARLVEQGRVA